MRPESAPARLWTAAEAAASDRHTMDELGVPSPILMERAALAVSAEIQALLAGEELPVLALCGPGNNGGDGLAVARQLRGRGVDARAVVVTPKHNAAVEEQLALARAYGVPVTQGFELPEGRTLLVDAMLGTGSRGAPRGEVAAAIEAIESLGWPVVAVDVPSGVDPDTGTVPGATVHADLTVTFERSKPGLHITPGRGHAGRVVVAKIGLVPAPDADGSMELISPDWVARELAKLPAGRHKGERGHLGLVAGEGGTPGAALIAGTAALRAGAGLVTLASEDPAAISSVLATHPELMLEQRGRPLLSRAGVLAVGPGLTTPESREGLEELWATDARPAVWDASGLEILPTDAAAAPRVITPHPGEAAGLLARIDDDVWDSARVQGDRVDAACRLAAATGAVTVLKGEGSVVAEASGRVMVCVTGGPALATAGSGDALTGLIGALLARGLEPWEAACVGVHVHGLAGDAAGRRRPGTLAMDIAESMGEALASGLARRRSEHWPSLRWG